jgi:hypothetical protein
LINAGIYRWHYCFRILLASEKKVWQPIYAIMDNLVGDREGALL